MEPIFEFFKNATPIMASLAIIGGLVHVVLLLLRSSGLMDKIRGTQVARTVAEMDEFDTINKKLDLVMNNHLHDLPVMMENIRSIKEDVSSLKTGFDTMKEGYGNRLTRLETLIDKK